MTTTSSSSAAARPPLSLGRKMLNKVPEVTLFFWVISVFGTLITDNMTDGHNVPLTTSTPIFAAILAVVFAVWFAFERTLSIHTIFTTRREAFYWLAILFTFALGTAAGDLTAEKLNVGYLNSVLMFGAMI